MTAFSLLMSAIVALSFSVPAALGAAPNDPLFSLQWADSNSGQSIPTQEAEELLGAPAPGTPGDDDKALDAWQVTTGSRSIVIGETDTGIDYEHSDLAANIWSNPGGIGGCPAGTHGYNVVAESCDPMDEDTTYDGHGTHVAGIMGAVANNGIGVAGMNWQTTILPVKWLSSAMSGETSALIEALQWLVTAKQAGVNIRVVNDSETYVDTPSSEALADEIEVLGENNILFVTAAGNTGENDDDPTSPRYPCGYDLPNEICVTASDNNDELPSWANYGAHTVDLAAPGVSIYSTLREGKYGYLSGGSMAAAQVSGAAALILAADPTLSAEELKEDILDNVSPVPELSGRVLTGGTLNVCKALPGCKESAPTAPPSDGEGAQGSPSTSVAATGSTTPVTGAPDSGVSVTPTTMAVSRAVAASTTLTTQDGWTTIKLRCRGPKTCRSRASLTVRVRVGRRTDATRAQSIGGADFSIPAGGLATVRIRLNAIGDALLSSARSTIKADLTIRGTVTGASKTQTESVRLVQQETQRPAVITRSSPPLIYPSGLAPVSQVG